MIRTLAEPVWFLLPAGFANMAPIFAARLFPSWGAPVDLGCTLGGVRIFGDHKTVRGLVAGVALATLVMVGQRLLYSSAAIVKSISIVDYESAPLWLGTLMGAGALAGDLVKSFLKRRIGRAPGKPWFPADQLDWVLGALAVTWPLVRFGAGFAVAAIATLLLITLLVKWLGWVVRLSDERF